jgi:hypothetical protein
MCSRSPTNLVYVNVPPPHGGLAVSGNVVPSAAVQQRTAAYTQEPRDVIIAFRITRSLAQRIESYQSLHHKKSRTEAVMELLEVALFIMENAQRLQDPSIVKYLQENLYNVQLVDDITEWPQDRIEAIIGALASERERRFRLKIGRHFHSSQA